jgi:hypothetical protein
MGFYKLMQAVYKFRPPVLKSTTKPSILAFFFIVLFGVDDETVPARWRAFSGTVIRDMDPDQVLDFLREIPPRHPEENLPFCRCFFANIDPFFGDFLLSDKERIRQQMYVIIVQCLSQYPEPPLVNLFRNLSQRLGKITIKIAFKTLTITRIAEQEFVTPTFFGLLKNLYNRASSELAPVIAEMSDTLCTAMKRFGDLDYTTLPRNDCFGFIMGVFPSPDDFFKTNSYSTFLAGFDNIEVDRNPDVVLRRLLHFRPAVVGESFFKSSVFAFFARRLMTQKDDALGTELAAFVLENTNQKTVSALLSTIWDEGLFRRFCQAGTSAVTFFRLSINVLDSFPQSTASLYGPDLHFMLLRQILNRQAQPGSLHMFAKTLAVFNRQFAVVNRHVRSMFKLKVDRLAEFYTDFIPSPAKLFSLLAWPTVLKDFEDGMAEFILSLASLTPAMAAWLFEFVERKSKALYIEITGKARTFVPRVVASVCAKFALQSLRCGQTLPNGIAILRSLRSLRTSSDFRTRSKTVRWSDIVTTPTRAAGGSADRDDLIDRIICCVKSSESARWDMSKTNRKTGPDCMRVYWRGANMS